MPGRTIDDFTGYFKGGAKANLFYWKPAFPGSVGETITNEEASYLVRSGSIPASTLEEGTLPWQGEDFYYATKRTYAPITFTFIVDYKAKIRQKFQDWSNVIHNSETNTFALTTDYFVDQDLVWLAPDVAGNTPLATVKLVGAWPQEIGEIALAHDNSETATFDVTIRYIRYVINFNR